MSKEMKTPSISPISALSQKFDRPAVHPSDLFDLAILQDAQLSPDGTTVAYSLLTVDTATDEEHSTIYVQRLSTGERRALTNGHAQDSAPRWSPDGKTIAFRSTRNGKAQIFVIAVDGGEATAITTLPQGVADGPIWSPDGARLAFSAPPQQEPPDTKLPYRLTRHLYRFDKAGYIDNVVADLYVMNADGGELRALTSDQLHNSTPVWSPDGSELLYTVTFFPDSHRVGAALRAVNMDGVVRDVIWEWGTVTSAIWSRDGQQIIFVGTPAGCPIGTQDQLWIVDAAGGEPRCRTTGLAYKVGGALQMDMPTRFLRTPRLFVSNDGNDAYVQIQVGGRVPIYRVALTGTPEWSVVVDCEGAAFPLDVQQNSLIYLYSTWFDPTQLYQVSLSAPSSTSTSETTEKPQQLTDLNAALRSEWDEPTVERLLFPGSDGTMVEGWIMLPAAGQAPYPTILYIHGGPHSAFGNIFSFDFRLLTSAGYAVLFINQRASTGYGDTFATQIKGDWGNLDYRDLMAGVDHAVALGLADADRLGCCGLSGGGNLSCWIVGQTDRFKAAVPENPVTNWQSFYGVSDIGPWFAVEQLGGHPHEIPEIYMRCSPITYAHRCKTPTLLIQGESDWRCPAEQSEQFYAVLKVNGCPVEMVRLPGSAHAGSIEGSPAIRRAHNEALLAWMLHYV
ncbi:MAG: S9 family peptidase [Caldilineaceae bacterium]|nr:S9 family peptidase [Caldilineaceae bacterium]